MRWMCVLLASSVVATSPWMMVSSARAESGGGAPAAQVPAAQGGLTAFRPLELPSGGAESVPEPSSAVAVGVVGIAFLVRRRRARLN